MQIKIVPEFEKALKKLNKKYPSLKSDFLQFLTDLQENNNLGIELYPNCHKARMAIKSKGKGKSSGARIIFYFQKVEDIITLLYVYDKSDIDNVSNDFIHYLLKEWFEENYLNDNE